VPAPIDDFEWVFVGWYTNVFDPDNSKVVDWTNITANKIVHGFWDFEPITILHDCPYNCPICYCGGTDMEEKCSCVCDCPVNIAGGSKIPSDQHYFNWHTWSIKGSFGQGGNQTHYVAIKGDFISFTLDIQASGTNYIVTFFPDGTTSGTLPTQTGNFTTFTDADGYFVFHFGGNVGGGHATLLTLLVAPNLLP